MTDAVPTQRQSELEDSRPISPVRAYLNERGGWAHETYLGTNVTVDQPPTTMQGAIVFFDECVRLINTKNADYRDAWREQGYMGNLARILSKVARLRNMLWTDGPEGSLQGVETIEDTLRDLANLTAFMHQNFEDRNRWGSDA